MAAGDPVVLNFGVKAIVSGAAGAVGMAQWSPVPRPADASHPATWYNTYAFLEQSPPLYLCFSGVIPPNAVVTNLVVQGTFLQGLAVAGDFNIEVGFNAIKAGAGGTDVTAVYGVTFKNKVVAALASINTPNPWAVNFTAAEHGLAANDELECWIKRSSDAPDTALGSMLVDAGSVEILQA